MIMTLLDRYVRSRENHIQACVWRRPTLDTIFTFFFMAGFRSKGVESIIYDRRLERLGVEVVARRCEFTSTVIYEFRFHFFRQNVSS